MSVLTVRGESSSPRTPEILNSLISMTNPFDSLKAVYLESEGHATLIPPIQYTRSKLIKEGLKLTLQTKRKQVPQLSFQDYSPLTPASDQLTPEDEERRRHRRERNKIAATKCRLKKREKTFNLVHESESLETLNMALKMQIQDLEDQKKRLSGILNIHAYRCSRQEHLQEYQEANGHKKHQQHDYLFKEYRQIDISCEQSTCYNKKNNFCFKNDSQEEYNSSYQTCTEVSSVLVDSSIHPSNSRNLSTFTSSSEEGRKNKTNSRAVSKNLLFNYDIDSDTFLHMFPNISSHSS